MRIIDVEYRDFYYIVDFSRKDMQHLKNILDHTDIKYDGEKEPEMVEAVKYLNEKLYPTIKKVIEETEGKPDNG